MGKIINISGQRFGFWVAQQRACNTTYGHSQWECICECGNIKLVTSNSLRTGNSTSCGCNHNPNLINIKFGKLKVLKINTSKTKSNKKQWLCQCDCNNLITATTYKLRNNLLTSCGYNTTDQISGKIDIQLNIQKNIFLIEKQKIILTEFNKELEKAKLILKNIQ